MEDAIMAAMFNSYDTDKTALSIFESQQDNWLGKERTILLKRNKFSFCFACVKKAKANLN